MIEAFLSTITAFFLFGTFWFWAIAILAVLIIAAEVHFDMGTSATFTLIGTVVFFHFVSGVNVLQFIYQNIFWFLLGAVGYVGFGATVWASVKIGLHTKNLSDKYRRAQIDFLRKHKLPDETDFKRLEPKLKEEWRQTLNVNMFDIDQRDGSVTFDLHKRRATVIMWIGHWPFSMVATLLNDPVRHAINFLYERMVGFYEKIINKNLGNTRGDILTYDERKKFEATQRP